ncbi:MAG: diguanylate cyclase [Clostridia bacterium]|nr:MAG: diguanylate cyclase [Clostridia bacterium]
MGYDGEERDQEREASWKRCVAAGVDPEAGRRCCLGAEALAGRRARAGGLLEEVHAVWEMLAGNSGPSRPAAWLVADAEGYLLDGWTTGDFSRSDSLPLSPGNCWREEYLGTNGLGTSLVLGRPFTVRGDGHYCRFLQPWCSVGVPVRVGPDGREVAGVVGLLLPLQPWEDLILSQWLALVWARAVAGGLNRRSQEELVRTNELILETTANGVITVDRDGRIVSVNRAACELFNLRPEDVLGKSHVDIFHQGHVYTSGGDYWCKLEEVLRTGKAFTRLERTYPHLTGDRVFSCDFLPFFDDKGQVVGAMSLYREVTEEVRLRQQLARAKEQLEAMVITDQVTGLYNHRFFQQRLQEELERAGHYHTSASLLRIDIDSFQNFNELFGSQAGDALLEHVGRTVRSLVRPMDVVARLNADEFAVLLLDMQASDAMEVADNVRQAVKSIRVPRGESNGRGWNVTVSAGVATYPVNSTDAASLFRQAGAAMDQAKDTGGDNVELYFKLLDDVSLVGKGAQPETFNTIKTLITVINAKDRYTYGHTERVVRYADLLGRHLGLSAEDMSWLRYGAFLHDIGKIEVSRELLNKKGALAAPEWDILKKHPVWGAEIVRSVNLLVPAAPIVLYHHERYDGRGYPAGLSVDDIPWLARILAVVDSFDAMTTTRPYKKARTLVEAIAEIRACAGSQFDPAVAEPFCQLLEEMQDQGLLYLGSGF